MSKFLRVKCSCGNVVNAAPGNLCSKCRQPLVFPTDAVIYLYRKGSPLGVAGGFGIYINGEPLGYIGNKETVRIPVHYGTYTLHVAAGMNRRCQDLVINVTPQNRYAFAKVWMKPGFWSNTFVLEPATASEMPEL